MTNIDLLTQHQQIVSQKAEQTQSNFHIHARPHSARFNVVMNLTIKYEVDGFFQRLNMVNNVKINLFNTVVSISYHSLSFECPSDVISLKAYSLFQLN